MMNVWNTRVIERAVKVAQCENAAKVARGGVNSRKCSKVLAAREEQGPPSSSSDQSSL
jgi:hypothetical protein